MNEIFRLMKRNRKRAARILAQRLKNRTHPPQGPKAAKELEKEAAKLDAELEEMEAEAKAMADADIPEVESIEQKEETTETE